MHSLAVMENIDVFRDSEAFPVPGVESVAVAVAVAVVHLTFLGWPRRILLPRYPSINRLIIVFSFD
jgi:hypothetical protein